jgi:hypothetical protein
VAAALQGIWQGEHNVIHPPAIAGHIPLAELTLVPGAGSLWTGTGLKPVLKTLVR